MGAQTVLESTGESGGRALCTFPVVVGENLSTLWRSVRGVQLKLYFWSVSGVQCSNFGLRFSGVVSARRVRERFALGTRSPARFGGAKVPVSRNGRHLTAL